MDTKQKLEDLVDDAKIFELLEDANKDAEGAEDAEDANKDTEESVIIPSDPEWTEHVIKQLMDDELVEGNPTVDGLRRITEQLSGTITSSVSQVVQVPTPENEKRATVVHNITVEGFDGFIRKVSGSADVYYGNTKNGYCDYPVAVAETRAEGRALRRLLKLKRVVTSEEVGDITENENITNKGNITDTQIRRLNIMGERNNVDLTKYLLNKFKNLTNIKQVRYVEVLKIFKELSEYQTEGTPDKFMGYNENWQFELNKE